MALQLYQHPFSSFCQKAKVAFYEKGIGFEGMMLDGSEPVASDFKALWPIERFPILRHEGRTIFESTAIIEYLDARFPETPRLLPSDALAAVDARMWDRFFDLYVNAPMQRMVWVALGRDPDDGEQTARWTSALETAYRLLDERMARRDWAIGEAFTMADCAAAPALLYADWAYEISDQHPHLRAYRTRLLARPSYARTLEEARPWRENFPLGAPEGRD